jgi:hypothetical protein
MHSLAMMHEDGDGLEQDHSKAAELIVMAIKKQNDYTLKHAPSEGRGAAFRSELQTLLKKEGVYWGSIDGAARGALKLAVLVLAAQSKGGG